MVNGEYGLNEISYYMKFNFVEKTPVGPVDPGSWTALTQTGDMLFWLILAVLLITSVAIFFICMQKKHNVAINSAKEYLINKGSEVVKNSKFVYCSLLVAVLIISLLLLFQSSVAHASNEEEHFQYNSKDVTFYVDPNTGEVSSEDIWLEFPYSNPIHDDIGFTADVYGDDFMRCHWNIKFNDDVIYDEDWIPVKSGMGYRYESQGNKVKVNINLSKLNPDLVNSLIGKAPIMGYFTFVDKEYLLKAYFPETHVIAFDISQFDVPDVEKFEAFCKSNGWSYGDINNENFGNFCKNKNESYNYCFKDVGKPNVPINQFTEQMSQIIDEGLIVPKNGKIFKYWLGEDHHCQPPTYVPYIGVFIVPAFEIDAMVHVVISTTSMQFNEKGLAMAKKYGWLCDYHSHWAGANWGMIIEGDFPASMTVDEFKAMFSCETLESSNHYAPFWRLQYGTIGDWAVDMGDGTYFVAIDSGHGFYNKAFVDGYVVDENGNPVSDLYINVKSDFPFLEESMGTMITSQMKTDKNGHYFLVLLGGQDSRIIFGGDENWDTNKEYIADSIYVKDAKSQTLPTITAKHYSKLQVELNNINATLLSTVAFDYVDDFGITHSYFSDNTENNIVDINVPANVSGVVRLQDIYYEIKEKDMVHTPDVGEDPLKLTRTLIPKDKNVTVNGKLLKDGIPVASEKLYFLNGDMEAGDDPIELVTTDESGCFSFDTYEGICGEFAVDFPGQNEEMKYLYCSKGLFTPVLGENYIEVNIPKLNFPTTSSSVNETSNDNSLVDNDEALAASNEEQIAEEEGNLEQYTFNDLVDDISAFSEDIDQYTLNPITSIVMSFMFLLF